MSYDLMVFDAAKAPRDRTEFLAWYREIVTWKTVSEKEGLSPNLRRFYDLFVEKYPPMNGPDAAPLERIDEPEVTDYSLTPEAIYLSFSWSVADSAYRDCVNAGLTAGVGFFDVSADDGAVLYAAGDYDRLMGL